MRGVILFKYILRKFLLNVLSVYLCVFTIVFIADFLELLRRAGKSGSVDFLDLITITLLRVPSFTEMTLQITVLIAAIFTFIMLSKTSELIIVRASGVSIWRFIAPVIFGAILVGLFEFTIYNPLSAWAKAQSEIAFGELFGKNPSLISKNSEGAWLRQQGDDGSSVIRAKSVAKKGLQLSSVSVIVYDKKHHFLERLDAKKAILKDNFWHLKGCWVSRPNEKSVFHKNYQLSTYLTPSQVSESLGATDSISFWDLPNQIELSKKAGLPATRFKIKYNYLLSTPILLAIMVLIAATCSLRIFRFGKVELMAIMGLIMGFGFFALSEFSRQLGLAEIVDAKTAIWVPLLIWMFVAITALLYLEDG